MAATEPCFYCGKPAAILCDGVLGTLKAPGTNVADRAAKAYTCNRPLCREHVNKHIPIHYNMGRRRSHWDSWDYCEDCIREGMDFGGNRIVKGHQVALVLVTMEEGLALQRRRLMRVGAEWPTLAGDPFLLVGGFW